MKWLYTKKKFSVARIARTFGISHGVAWKILKQEGVKFRRQGTDNANYKGEKLVTKNGYVMVYCPVEFAAMRNQKTHRVFEHRLVMAKHIGRPLEDYETVHHIDGDTARNNIENLQLRIGRHGKGSAYECLDCGSANIAPVPLR